MRLKLSFVVIAIAIAAVANGQTQPDDPLNRATQLLGTMDVPNSAAADRIAALKQDFADFASTYLATPPAGVGATAGAAGTAGSQAPPAGWRAKYQRVEADLGALLGDGSAQATSAVPLAPDTRRRLDDVRTQLRLFYASTLGDRAANPVAHTGISQVPPAATPAATPPPVAPTGEAPQTAPINQTSASPNPAIGANAQPPAVTSPAASPQSAVGSQPAPATNQQPVTTGQQTMTGQQPTAGSQQPTATGTNQPATGTQPTGVGQATAGGQRAAGTQAPNTNGGAATTVASQADSQWGTALALLDRMQRILDNAIKDAGKVSLDRPSIDEMRAEIAQIRAMLTPR